MKYLYTPSTEARAYINFRSLQNFIWRLQRLCVMCDMFYFLNINVSSHRQTRDALLVMNKHCNVYMNPEAWQNRIHLPLSLRWWTCIVQRFKVIFVEELLYLVHPVSRQCWRADHERRQWLAITIACFLFDERNQIGELILFPIAHVPNGFLENT